MTQDPTPQKQDAEEVPGRLCCVLHITTSWEEGAIQPHFSDDETEAQRG